MSRSSLRKVVTITLAAGLCCLGPLAAADEPTDSVRRTSAYREVPDDPPASFDPRDDESLRSPGRRIPFGSYVVTQVNVDALGRNIVGDAANEPSIAVDPLDADNMIIGWRQFDNVASNFRQAGFAYTQDGGATWTFPGVLQPGVFRSDPVLDTDLAGTFFYNSLLGNFDMDVWRLPAGAPAWLPPVAAFGGDKNWFVVDKSLAPTSGNLYGIWQRFFGCCGRATVIRSTDGGDTYQPPVETPNKPTFGTMAVAADGTLFAAGIQGTAFQDFSTFVVDFRGPGTPGWVGRVVPLGGSMALGSAPNPDGLLGQANVAVDRSSGPTAGYVYLLASVDPPGGDPMDVHLARSRNGGFTWDAPVRVNDDAGTNWQWLAAHSVSPDGRVDVVWLDTRNTGQATLSQLFYAYSWDGGTTWLGNVAVTPPFDSTVGWPNQAKMGDYMTLVSNATAADVAFAATLNGEQDVYYASLFPDCNGNAVSDVVDILDLTSDDVNGNRIPDECELVLGEPVPGRAGEVNSLAVAGATPGAIVWFVGGPTEGTTPIPGCETSVDLGPGLRILGSDVADGSGAASVAFPVPAEAAGRTGYFQAVEQASCLVSNRVATNFP